MNNQTKPAVSIAQVRSCKEIQEGIFSLKVEIPLIHENSSLPKNGQFYMLRAKHSSVLLQRPISVYSIYEAPAQNMVGVEFLILQKGTGTQELCSLNIGDLIEVTGPLGNYFYSPNSQQAYETKEVPERPKVAIVGGGIGVAPVAGFASSLELKSYDFYACFKSSSYGLNLINPAKLLLTTDDGSEGVKGMLPAIFNEEVIQKEQYDIVYACGPLPMLSYIKRITENTKTQCWISMESKMACGVGACLGCTIKTLKGNKRCCKDGPIFSATELIF